MTIASSSFRPETVHALTSSKLFRKEVDNRRSIIADPQLSITDRDLNLYLTHKHIEDLAVVQWHEATIEEIQEAFKALGRRSKKNLLGRD